MTKKIYFIFFLIIFSAAFLRLYKLSSLPGELHRDEVAIAYNAYSLLETGHDEHGQKWPFIFQSFGDYKLPGLIYSTLPFIKILGLNALATRLPTAFFAILTLPALFCLVKKIGLNKKFALLSMALLAFDFWHITQARNAYEPIVGLFFTILAWTLWLQGIKENQKYFIGAILTFGVGILFYNLPFLLLPILFLGSSLIYRKEIKFKKIVALSFLIILLINASFLYLSREVSISKSKTTIFNSQNLYDQSQNDTHASLVAGLPSPLARISNHRWSLAIWQAGKGYLSAFDFSYLFFLGDHNPWHNLRSISLGNINPLLVIPFLAGLFYIMNNLQKKSNQLFLLYLLASPIFSSLTIDSPITNRLLDLHTAILLTSTLGIHFLFKLSKKHKLKHLFFMGIIAYLGFFSYFFLRYFYLYNWQLSEAWQPGIKKMIKDVDQMSRNYEFIFIENNQLAYIHFAFYNAFPAQDFIKKALWQKDGFERVIEFQKYRFYNFPDWKIMTLEETKKYFSSKNTKLLIVTPGIVTPGRESKTYNMDKIVYEQKNWKGDILWRAWEINSADALKNINIKSIVKEKEEIMSYLIQNNAFSTFLIK